MAEQMNAGPDVSEKLFPHATNHGAQLLARSSDLGTLANETNGCDIRYIRKNNFSQDAAGEREDGWKLPMSGKPINVFGIAAYLKLHYCWYSRPANEQEFVYKKTCRSLYVRTWFCTIMLYCD